MSTVSSRDQAQARREYFAQLRKKLGIATIAQLAEHLELSPSQIYNLCRVDRHASPALLDKLRKLAPTLDPSSLVAQDQEVATANLSHVISDLRGATFTAFQSTQREISNDAYDIFSTMGEGDYYVLFTLDEIPVELDPSSEGNIQTTMKQALREGATFIYCIPDADSPAAAWTHRFKRRTDILQMDDEKVGILSDFKAQLADSEKDLAQKIHCLRLRDCPYFVPEFKFALYISRSMPKRCAASMSFYAQKDGAAVLSLHAFLSNSFAQKMRVYLASPHFGQLISWAGTDLTRQNLYQEILAALED